MKRKCKRRISKSKTKKHKYVSEDGKVIVLDDEEFRSLKQLQKTAKQNYGSQSFERK